MVELDPFVDDFLARFLVLLCFVNLANLLSGGILATQNSSLLINRHAGIGVTITCIGVSESPLPTLEFFATILILNAILIQLSIGLNPINIVGVQINSIASRSPNQF
jgi:hypothetical protein